MMAASTLTLNSDMPEHSSALLAWELKHFDKDITALSHMLASSESKGMDAPSCGWPNWKRIASQITPSRMSLSNVPAMHSV